MSNPALVDIASDGCAVVSEVLRLGGSAAKIGVWGSLGDPVGRLTLKRATCPMALASPAGAGE